MNIAANVRRNSFFALLTHFIRLFANFFVFVGIARFYGPVEFGQFTSAHTLAGIFLLFADYGFDTLLIREIAHGRSDPEQALQSLFSIKVLFAAIATMVMTIFASVVSLSAATRILAYAFCLYVMVSAVLNFFFFAFRARQELDKEAKTSFVMNSLLLVGVLFVGMSRMPLIFIAIGFILTRTVGIILSTRKLFFKPKWIRFDFARINKEDLRRINIYGLYGILGTILFSIDTVLLSILGSDYQVGLYQSVTKVSSLALLASDIMVYSTLPALVQMHQSDLQGSKVLARYIHRTLFYVGILVSFFMIVFPASVISLVYGLKEYSSAVPIMRMFGCVILVRYCSEAAGMILTSSDRQLQRLAVVAVATTVNLALNLLLIPKYGMGAAAIVALVTNVIVGAGYLYVSRAVELFWSIDPIGYVPMVVALVLGFIFWRWNVVNSWVSVGLSAAIIVASILFCGFTRLERRKIFMVKSVGDFLGSGGRWG